MGAAVILRSAKTGVMASAATTSAASAANHSAKTPPRPHVVRRSPRVNMRLP